MPFKDFDFLPNVKKYELVFAMKMSESLPHQARRSFIAGMVETLAVIYDASHLEVTTALDKLIDEVI